MPFDNLQPAIPGFHPDPTMCAGPDAVYLANSSFEYFPGAPVFRSEDLGSWELVANVLHRRDQLDLATFAGASAGLYGSTLRHHDGQYWFITTNIATNSSGQLIFTASDPTGPWSDPVVVPGTEGIDPDLCWDDDGTCFLTWCGPQSITQVTVDPSTGRVLSERRPLWSGTGMKYPEGPHLYHVGEFWYLLIAEGGTERGHSVSVARSSRPDGGFEPCPANPILTHRSTSHPVQSVGHADLVEWRGRWWACYHGTRPHGQTPEFHVLGRETMVCPVEWVDGWPVFREDLAGSPAPDTSLVTDFRDGLGPRWVSPQGDLADAQPDAGGLTLRAADGPARPVVIRVEDLEWQAEATLDVTAGTARLLLYLDDEHFYGLDVDAAGVRAVARSTPFEQTFGTAPAPTPDAVMLRIAARFDTSTPWPREPDLISLSVLEDGLPVTVAELDGRHLSTEVAGGFTGRTVGVQCLAGTVRCTSFAYRPGAPAPRPDPTA